MPFSSPSPASALATLRAIRESHPSDLEDVAILRGRLADRQIPASEINALVNAVADGVPQRIRRERADTPRPVLFGILVQRLIESQGMSRDRAEWTANVWLDALATPTDAASEAGADNGEYLHTQAVSSVPKESPPLPRRALLVAGLTLGGAALLGMMWLVSRGSENTIERISFYTNDSPVGQDLDELKDYNAWCDAGASLIASGPPPWPCASVFPFKTTTPVIKVELLVSYTGQGSAEASLTCQLRDQSEQVIASARGTGVTPNPRYPGLGRTWWLAGFERPGPVWPAGRHHVTCEADGQSIEGWLDVRD